MYHISKKWAGGGIYPVIILIFDSGQRVSLRGLVLSIVVNGVDKANQGRQPATVGI